MSSTTHRTLFALAFALASIGRATPAETLPAETPPVQPAAAEKPTTGRPTAEERGWTALFPKDGVPEGWVVREWNDLAKPAAAEAVWTVKDGILRGSSRGTWLVWEKEVSDFELEFEFKLGTLGNSGCALRAPMKGDPAFDGLELQMADFRYNTSAKDSELTGGLYRAVAPKRQVYRPEEWNKYRVVLKGTWIQVTLNDELILDLDLAAETKTVPRHDGTPAPALKDRPRSGHLGFQELSRGDDHVQIRGARIRILDAPPSAGGSKAASGR